MLVEQDFMIEHALGKALEVMQELCERMGIDKESDTIESEEPSDD